MFNKIFGNGGTRSSTPVKIDEASGSSESNGDARSFDLNIEKILEGWENCHAIRELIANALDEQALTSTKDVEIRRTADGAWRVRDMGAVCGTIGKVAAASLHRPKLPPLFN
ncbi:MAG: hypothetical protein V4559_08865 [Pseudomonadota bacterium]